MWSCLILCFRPRILLHPPSASTAGIESDRIGLDWVNPDGSSKKLKPVMLLDRYAT
jgi:hypothetical protein